MLPPNAPIAIGKKAIRESWAGLLGPGVAVSWTVTKVEVATAGDMAYLVGAYQLTMKNPPLTDRGKVMEVWKKQADGKWKCVADTYNSDMPLPATPAKAGN
jgi:ketosteroid isomerase-like protein